MGEANRVLKKRACRDHILKAKRDVWSGGLLKRKEFSKGRGSSQMPNDESDDEEGFIGKGIE